MTPSNSIDSGTIRDLYAQYLRQSEREPELSIARFHEQLQQRPQGAGMCVWTMYKHFKKLRAEDTQQSKATTMDLSGGLGEITAVLPVHPAPTLRQARTRTPVPLQQQPLATPSDDGALGVRYCGMDFRISSEAAAQLFLRIAGQLKAVCGEV